MDGRDATIPLAWRKVYPNSLTLVRESVGWVVVVVLVVVWELEEMVLVFSGTPTLLSYKVDEKDPT